jgi:ATP-dependent DNA helicase RecG
VSGDLVALIDYLRGLATETEWLEFKRNRYDSQEIGEYLSALANAACLANQPRGYLVFGIDDGSHDVVGTRFDPYTTKGKGNQDMLPWLSAGLRPNTGVDTHIVEHPDGRIRDRLASPCTPLVDALQQQESASIGVDGLV